MAGYDQSFYEFRDTVGDDLDLRQTENAKALLHWLNHWGCRHLATHCHDMAATALVGWFQELGDRLPPPDARLVSIPEVSLDSAAQTFDKLSGLVVARRTSYPEDHFVSFGPTAAAKTLFALRPHVFVPWDVAMRQEFGHDGSGRSYVDYLKEVRAKLRDIERQCDALQIELEALPARLGRERSTATQLIDEYHWITVTRHVLPPDRQRLLEWLTWS